MVLSSTHCRAQEAQQRERAASATLDNERRVAQTAAAAWQREALLAERFEASKAIRLAIATVMSVESGRSEADDDGPPSENPDRGHADD